MPLVAVTALVVAAGAPLAFFLQKRQELVGGARASAERVSQIIADARLQHPRLWRYDAPKIAERLAAEGISGDAVVVRDALGRSVPIDRAGLSSDAGLIWGRTELSERGTRVATVWVGRPVAPLIRGTAVLAGVFAGIAALLGMILYLLPMRAIGASERRLLALVAELGLTLKQDERRRIARELHDGAGQALTAARLRLLALKRGLPDGAVDAIARHIDEALDEVRRSTAALAPPALAELGLHGALERHCETFGPAAGLAVACEVSSGVPKLASPVETACYRIVQEALANTARHAAATRAWVRLGVDDGGAVRLEIGDDGRGLGDRPAEPLFESIRDRARRAGGSLAVQLTAGSGVTLVVVFPAEASEASEAAEADGGRA